MEEEVQAIFLRSNIFTGQVFSKDDLNHSPIEVQKFEEYMAWNSKITSRESLVISKASRDEYPLSCNGEQFTNDNEDPLPRWLSDI